MSIKDIKDTLLNWAYSILNLDKRKWLVSVSTNHENSLYIYFRIAEDRYKYASCTRYVIRFSNHNMNTRPNQITHRDEIRLVDDIEELVLCSHSVVERFGPKVHSEENLYKILDYLNDNIKSIRKDISTLYKKFSKTAEAVKKERKFHKYYHYK